MSVNRLLLFLAAICTFWIISPMSCSKSPTEEEDDIPTRDYGEFLHYYGMNSHWLSLIWSRNTNELFFAGNKGIQAVDLSALTVRTIEGADGVSNSFSNSWDLSHDGSTLYYLLTGASSHGPLYRISIDGQNRQLLDQRECCELCSSIDDAQVAYYVYHPSSDGAADSIFTFDLDNHKRTFLCIGCPLTFSADSKSLLYYCWTHPDSTRSQNSYVSFYFKSIATGECCPVTIGTPYGQVVPKLFCDHSGIYALLYSPKLFQYCVRNITTNEILYSWKTNVYGYGPSYTFSSLGTKIAYWSVFFDDNALNLVDLVDKKESRIAYSQERCAEHSIAFSPDDLKIAYAFGESIYMKEIM